jgi:hypothetical protein
MTRDLVGDDRWARLGRRELIALGRATVTHWLEDLGCSVDASGGPLQVVTPSGRRREVFVSTQRVGGYAFWTKRRLPLAAQRLVAIVVLDGDQEPAVYVVPTSEWHSAQPPLRDRPNVGKKSEPEYGVSLARSSLGALGRYGARQPATLEQFR